MPEWFPARAAKRIRRHARRLRRAAGSDEGASRGADSRTLAALFARVDRLHRLYPGGTGAPGIVAAVDRPHPSGIEAQDAVSGVARHADPRHANSRGPHLVARSDGT